MTVDAPRAVVCLRALVSNGLNPSQADAIERLRELEQGGRLADLDIETGRPTDAYSYRLRELETGDTLLATFRHQDFVPAEDSQ